MAAKIDDDEDDFDEVDDEDGAMLEDFDEIDDKEIILKDYSDARRRLEQIREDKELERLIRGEFDDWD
ncbi:MAG: hypothetical protein OEY87_03195 [Gammaproteobacteria bacterium]|nr:hypothetical protein [Gammaproteobacteria bacterium]MDH5735107.1 hypothetical protein [Gammaproteobacteria bacterium]